MSDATKIVVTSVTQPSGGDARGWEHRDDWQVTLQCEDGRFFKVNIPKPDSDCGWGWDTDSEDAVPHGLNLVYGEGCHYT
tara:strand:+ start:208 stop:447 length:240 start_codon:yes stop_codon:yes gene_type:complete